MKIDIESVRFTLQEHGVEAKKIELVVKDLEETAQSEKTEKGVGTKKKNIHYILLSDPDGKLAGIELTGWVITMPDGEDPNTLLDKISRAAVNHNNNQKRKKLFVKTIGEAIMYVKRKWAKQENFLVKTAEPTWVFRTDNKFKSPN